MQEAIIPNKNINKSENLNKDNIKYIIDNNFKFFENMVVVSLIRSIDFWKEFCQDKINSRIDLNNKYNKTCFEDFTSATDNDIYECVNDYYSMFVNTNSACNIKCISIAILISMFQGKISSGEYTSQDLEFLNVRLEELKDLINCEESTFQTSILTVAKDGFSYWLELRRVHQISHINRNKNISADDMISKIKSASVDIKSFEVDAIEVDDAIENDETGNRMAISTMPILTKIMGGGVMKGEPGLIVAVPGGGKTIIACQIAQGLAAGLNKTVCYSTEQPASKLVPRMISAATNIPFMYIRDGIKSAIDKNILSKSQINQIEEWILAMKGKLFFENWCTSGNRIKTHLEKSLQWYSEHGGIDAVVFDWIGGGVEFVPTGESRKSDYYNYTTQLFVNLCKKYNIFGLMTAQINPKQAERVSHITINEVDSCKTLDQYFTWAAGISAIPESVVKAATSIKSVYKTQQTFNIWKNRLGNSTSYPIIREFEYQRFSEKEILMPDKSESKRIVLDDIYQGDNSYKI